MISHRQRARFGHNEWSVSYDGNSIFNGTGAKIMLPLQSAAAPPLGGTGANIHTLGISGQTWRNMDGLDGQSSSDIDYYYDPTRKNLIIAWETTNSITQGRTALQAVQDAADYIEHRRALHPDVLIVVMTTIPRYLGDSRVNALITADNYMRTSWMDMGIDLLFDTRKECPVYNFVGDNAADYMASQDFWFEPGPNNWVHPNTNGCTLIAQALGGALRSLPAHSRHANRVWKDRVSPTLCQAVSQPWNVSQVEVDLSKLLNQSYSGGASAWSVTASGGAVSVTAATTSGGSVFLSLSRAITHGETVTFSYTKPSSNYVKDMQGNAFASLTHAVVNNI